MPEIYDWLSKFFSLMYFVPVTNVDDLMMNICCLYCIYIHNFLTYCINVLKASRETSIVLIELPSLNKEFIIIIIIGTMAFLSLSLNDAPGLLLKWMLYFDGQVLKQGYIVERLISSSKTYI